LKGRSKSIYVLKCGCGLKTVKLDVHVSPTKSIPHISRTLLEYLESFRIIQKPCENHSILKMKPVGVLAGKEEQMIFYGR
jgi:hypothetical protein